MSAWPWVLTCQLGATPGLAPPGWDDVTDRLRRESIQVTYGRPDEMSADVTGTGAVRIDNRDGHWSPGVEPGTAVKVTADVGGVIHPVLYGIVESAPSVWPERGSDAVVEVSTADGMALLAREDVGGVTRPPETSGSRIDALLDAGSWPAGLRDLDSGVVVIDALDQDESGDILTVVRDAVEAEQGQAYIAPDGRFTFRDRHSRLDADPVYSFGGTGMRVHVLAPTYDDLKLYTVGRAEMADGQTAEFRDEAAVAVYGPRVFVVRDLTAPVVEAEAVAAWTVVRYSRPARRWGVLELEGRAGPDELAAALGLRPGHLVRIVYDPPGAGDTVDELVHAERIDHRIGAGSWRTTVELSPYFGAGPWLTLDDPVLGVLGADNKLAP